MLLTGAGRAFSAGNDLNEMQARITDPAFNSQGSRFSGMIDALTDLRKPLICAVNGVGVGIGATILGYADLVFMSSTARLKMPVHQPGRRTRGGVVISAAAIDRQAERGMAVDVVGVDRRGRGAADGACLESVRAGRSAARSPPARRSPCLPTDFEPDGGQADDRRALPRGDRGSDRQRDRAVRRTSRAAANADALAEFTQKRAPN